MTRLEPIRETSRPFKDLAIPEQRAEYSVANTKSAEKAALQAEKHRARNVMLRSRMRGAIRKVTAAVDAGNGEQARGAYQEAVPVIDSQPRSAARARARAISAWWPMWMPSKLPIVTTQPAEPRRDLSSRRRSFIASR